MQVKSHIIMKLQKLLILGCFFLTIPFLQAQDLGDPHFDLRVDVVYLASDYLEGRLTGTPGEDKAATYIAARYKELGLSPKGDDGTFYHFFPFKELTNPHAVNAKPAREGKGKNVVGYLDNGAATTVIIGAHYDHLGMGGIGSLHAGEPAIHNGADDNASGVAAMLDIAKQLKASDAKANNYLFIAFSGEELGLFGSKNYAENPTIDLATVNYMLNMDMVGRLNKEKTLVIYGTGTSSIWPDVLPNVKVGDIQTKTSESGVGASDHTSFYLKGIPVLHFFTGQHTDYHKPQDDTHLINFEGLQLVSDYLVTLIKRMDGYGKLDFKKTKEEQERKAAAFKVTLGVMPDYVYTGEGMRIDSVIKGRVADKGGLKDGDVVMKIGDYDVPDIYKYMEALSKHKKGDKAEVVVKRGKKEVTKTVKFE